MDPKEINNELVIGDLTIILCEEMVQMINDELNITFTSVNSLDQIKDAFESNKKNLEYDGQVYEGYIIVQALGFKINNKGEAINKIALKRPVEAIDPITPDEEKAIAYAVKYMPDEHALNCIGAFPEYKVGHNYKVDDRFQYQGNLFKVIQAHTSQVDWLPDVTKSLYVEVADPSIAFPEFIQPAGAHDAYKKGDKVAYKGKKYESLIDNNVWAPDAYPQGWKEVQ